MANLFSALRREKNSINIPPVVVIGLGRFGASLAKELMEHGVEVLGIDADEKFVREHADYLTEVVTADSTDSEALHQLGVDEVERVVLGIGTDLEASILTASNLVELGIKDIWAKADSDAHARILTQIGVQHVIRPERDTGRRVAHLLGGRFEDFAEIAVDYGVTVMSPPASASAGPVNLQKVWEEHHVQLISRCAGPGQWHPLADATQLTPRDLIAVAGSPADLEAFSQS